MTFATRASVIVLSLLAAGCGGDDVDSGDTTGVSTGPGTGGSGSTGSPGDDGTPGSSDSGMGSSDAAESSTAAGDDTGTSAGDDTTGDSGSGSDTGAAAPTWDNFGAGFFESYCWECHGAGDPLRDYSTLAGVMAESNAIRCGTAPAGAALTGCDGEPPEEQFPIGATLPTADERAMLVAWIDAGLPEN